MFVGLAAALSLPAVAQQQNYADTTAQCPQLAIDSTSLLHALKAGRLQGDVRYFFMSTQNQPGLTDYYAHAGSIRLRYESAGFRGFHVAVGVYNIFNIHSSDFKNPDAATGQYDRYETSLFDVTAPTQRKALFGLDEFYIQYNFNKSQLVVGQQLINSAFINPQDGRMRPTAVEAVWLALNEIPKTIIEVGWVNKVSPRGTVNWYSVGKSIGLYSNGVNPDGTKADYGGNVKSAGVAVLGITTHIHKNIKLQFLNMFTQNVFNTAMLQADLDRSTKNGASFFVALQVIRQNALNNGGNIDQSKTYFTRGQKSTTFGGKFGWRNLHWEASINYNRITSEGRNLVPREWGKEPFFTFLPRERNDGLGDVHASAIKLNYNIPKTRLKTMLAAGFYSLPDVKNYRLNKYGLPSYAQVNAELRYSFVKMLKGLDAQILVAGKIRAGETYHNDKYVFNKVNMMNYNFVLNYHF